MLLAIDTATHLASLALYDQVNGCVLGEESWHSAGNHTVELMPRLVHMMEQQGASAGDLSGLAVSLGPGSFTGLRIGLALAKGLAVARKLPIAGVPTLDVVIQPHKAQRLPIWAILQAGRGRICAGYYERRRGKWERQEPYRLTTVEALCDLVKDPVLFCGELSASEADLLRRRLDLVATVATPAHSLRRAAYLAELAWQRLARGDVDDVASLSPIYLPHPQIDA